MYVEQIELGDATGPRTIISGLANFVPLAEMQVCLFLIHSRLLLLWSSPARVGVGVPILSTPPTAGEARGGAVQPEAAEDARHHVGGHGEKNLNPQP